MKKSYPQTLNEEIEQIKDRMIKLKILHAIICSAEVGLSTIFILRLWGSNMGLVIFWAVILLVNLSLLIYNFFWMKP